MKLIALIRTLRDDRASSLVELALVMPMLCLLLFASFDFGRGYYLADEVQGAAHSGAEYGIQNPTDSTGIAAAASSDAPNVSNLNTAVSYGCECSDGTHSSVNCATSPTSCTYNVVYWVKVVATATYSPTFHWVPGIPSSISLSSTAVMRSSEP